MLPQCAAFALQTALRSVTLCSPFSGFLADRVPRGLQRGAGYVSCSITAGGQSGQLLGGSGRGPCPDALSSSLTWGDPLDFFVSLGLGFRNLGPLSGLQIW